jgi:hypothetical protein
MRQLPIIYTCHACSPAVGEKQLIAENQCCNTNSATGLRDTHVAHMYLAKARYQWWLFRFELRLNSIHQLRSPPR